MSARRFNEKSVTGQRGVALVTILLVVAVLTAVLSRVSLSNQVWSIQVEHAASQAQARQAGRAVHTWVASILEEDNELFDAYTDDWAQTVPAIPVSWGQAQGWLEDMNGRFNVNNLVDQQGRVNTDALKHFQRLLLVLELQEGIAQAVLDWMDVDSEVSGTWGAEDAYYLGQLPAYLPSNQRLGEVDELRMVRGISEEVWQRLKPHVIALPTTTRVNVNTATVPVLAAVLTSWGSPKNALGKARSWLQQARVRPAPNIVEFAKQQMNIDKNSIPEGIAVNSDHFMAHLKLSFDELEYRTASLFYRKNNRADLIWQARRYD